MRILSRVTLPLQDVSLNYNIAKSTENFDLIAIRPTSEKTLQYACQSMDVDIISLDLSVRLPYYLKYSTVGAAISRGVFLEICYASSMADISARRQLISNAANLVRVTKGRGIIISSEAANAMNIRGPYDIINLATFWGLSQEMGRDAISENARKVCVKADTRRRVYKGVLRLTKAPLVTFKRPEPQNDRADKNVLGKKAKKQKTAT